MKIFISSTYEDLKEHRLAVRNAILRLGHHPIGMEDFGARPKEWNKAALDAIDGCGALVGIYAHRYGAIPQGDTLSITEQEFDRARAKSIPCFCYRLDPEHPWPLKSVDRGRARTNLNRFLQKVDQLLRSTFTDPKDLAGKVAADLGRELERAAPLSARYSLPSPPRDFTGRNREQEALLKNLAGEGAGVTISGLAGMGGVGKTALALVVAQKLAERYRDAQIFINLKGTTPTPLASSEAMRQVIHAFEPQADLRQATEEEIAALYRSILHGKHALLVLDNAATAAQVVPLLPPPTCVLLVTSRRYFTLPGFQPLRLEVMNEADARYLLLKLCGRIDGHADKIAGLCAYLPLALRIAGSALAEQSDLSPARYAERLANRRARLATLKSTDDPDLNVEATFAYSYDLLPAEAQTRWRALSVFPAPFDQPAAAAVWALATEPARHAEHYLEVAQTADKLYLQGGERTLKGLALFDAEWPHIQAGQSWAATNREASEEAARLASAYPGAAAYCLALRLHSRDQIAWLELAVTAARQLREKKSEGNHLGNLGLAYADLGEVRKAIEYHEQAVAISREIGDRQGEGADLLNLALAHEKLAEVQEAIQLSQAALGIFDAIESPDAQKARELLERLTSP